MTPAEKNAQEREELARAAYATCPNTGTWTGIPIAWGALEDPLSKAPWYRIADGLIAAGYRKQPVEVTELMVAARHVADAFTDDDLPHIDEVQDVALIELRAALAAALRVAGEGKGT